MKKIISVMILLMLVTVLSGCDLAIQDDYYALTDHSNGKKQTEDYYIPSGISFRVYKGTNMSTEIDVTDYFYVNFACPDMTVFDNCSSTDIGKSIQSFGSHLQIDESTVNGVEQATIITNTIELTFYALKDNELTIYSSIFFENAFGDTKTKDAMGTNFASGVTISGTIEGEKEDGTIYILDYTFHYVAVDELELVTVKQFDQDDNLLQETIILSDNILEELVLHEDAQYFFIIEDYIDEEGNPYQERIYNDVEQPFYYLYKYCNEDGFLNGDRLVITKSEVN